LVNGGAIAENAYYLEGHYLDMFFYLEMPFDFIVAASIV